MVVCMKVNGWIILNMEKDMKNLTTTLSIKENMLKGNPKVLVAMSGLMVKYIKDNGSMD